MAAFYDCKQCGNEFLGPDNIPIDDESVEPICERCGLPYECGICGDLFYPTVHTTIDGAVFTGNCDYCPPCSAIHDTIL